jgi:6-phosphogluconate dehydrogenase
VHDALYASKIISYAQGLDLMRTVSDKKGWALDLGGIAGIWRGGCIIRARFLGASPRPTAPTRRCPT